MYLDPTKKPEVHFKWTGFPKEWVVSAQLGPGRRQMKDLATAEAGVEQLASVVPFGKHYWRLVARDPQTHEIKAKSPIYKMEVLARSTPSILFPTPNSQVESEKLPADVELAWQKTDGQSSQLVLEVAKDPQLLQKIITQRVDEDDKYTLKNLSEGTYYWRISSFYPDVKEPWVGPVQQFKVVKKADVKPIPVTVSWDQVPAEQFFIGEPSLHLAWTAGPQSDLVNQWKVSWKDEADVNAPPQTIETANRDLSTKLEKPGRYIASVEAYDKQGRLMGKSENMVLAVQPQPVLPAPQILPADGPITAGGDGKGVLSWSEIAGAKEYEVTLLSKDGKELLSHRDKKNQMILKNLMPGEYTVRVVSIDENNRPSDTPSEKTLIVPDKSNLRAPALKKVKVN